MSSTCRLPAFATAGNPPVAPESPALRFAPASHVGVFEELVDPRSAAAEKFPDTAMKFPDLLNVFPVNSRRELREKSLRHSFFSPRKRGLNP
jgi:hypothetical protein